jgi:hypothetical protein
MDREPKTKVTPFDYVNSVFTKKYMDDLSEFSPFLALKALSLHPSTVMYAAEINSMSGLTPRMQYDYLFYSIRKQKPLYAKWPNKSKAGEADLEAVKEYFKYNDTKAKQALAVLTKEQLQTIKEKNNKGGYE